MTPEQRKAASELLLRDSGIPINPHLPLIEPEEDLILRSRKEVLHRIVALWIVAGTAFSRDNTFREYVTSRALEPWLSSEELEFLFNDDRPENDYIRYSWRLESLYFLSWCAGLIETISIPTKQSNIQSILHLFPRKAEPLDILDEAIRVRTLGEVTNWADLLYRLHWAVRDAQLAGRSAPGHIIGGVIQEWHQAVNWMIHYGDEDDWDQIGTDT